MKIEKNYELWAFRLAAFIGGVFGSYAVIRYGMFSSAQTMNILTMLLSLFGTNFGEFLFRLVVALFYAFGVAVGVLVPRYTKVDLRFVSIIVTAVSTAILVIAPEGTSPEIISIPIFFAMALQWGAFPGANGYASACVFLTNNFRQTIMGFTNYICTKEKKYLDHCKFYLFTILSYALGCSMSYYLMRFFGYRAIVFAIIPLILIFFIIRKDKKEAK